MKCLVQSLYEQKCKFLKKYTNNFSHKINKFRSHIKCRYKIISRSISIKVLWKSSYLNILNKYGFSRLHTLFF